jgi:hypothetical protein
LHFDFESTSWVGKLLSNWQRNQRLTEAATSQIE